MNPARPKTPSRRRHRAVARTGLAIAALIAGSCSKPQPPAEQRLLVIDGIEIRRDEVAPYVEFLDSFRPDAGHKTKVRRALEDHVLPLRLAQRAFPAERAAELEKARALCSVATNVLELEQQSAQVRDKLRKDLTRMSARLPVAMFLFDPLRTGSVSDPIELPQGWFVVGCYDLLESPLALSDYVDALQVGFVTHDAGAWYEWYEAEKKRIAEKATFVHPDYRDFMPDWIRLPRNP